MKIWWRIIARFYEVRANRARAKAACFKRTSEKFFRRVKGLPE